MKRKPEAFPVADLERSEDRHVVTSTPIIQTAFCPESGSHWHACPGETSTRWLCPGTYCHQAIISICQFPEENLKSRWGAKAVAGQGEWNSRKCCRSSEDDGALLGLGRVEAGVPSSVLWATLVHGDKHFLVWLLSQGRRPTIAISLGGRTSLCGQFIFFYYGKHFFFFFP